jgi:hypothetical protein
MNGMRSAGITTALDPLDETGGTERALERGCW